MEKFYVGYTNKVKIICPKCGLERNKIVFKFKDTHKRLKAKCKCGEVFRFTLDFRNCYRKNVRLNGEYYIQDEDESGEVLIKNISMTGINFATLKPHNFSEDDIVELKIIFNTQIRMELHTLVKISWIIDHNVGGQFFDPRSLEKDLMPYLNA